MSTDAIRDTIALAKGQEQQHRHLARLMESRAQQTLHFAIQLPEDKPVAALVDFVISYIEHVPDLIDEARATVAAANIQAVAGPFLTLAEDFFLKPPEMVANHVGLHELMDEAYLAHRLIEEINDRFMAQSNTPLVQVDMSIANLIIHSLIGEPFANELDEAVNYTVGQAKIGRHVFQTAAFKNFLAAEQRAQQGAERPCLADQLCINLRLPGYV